MCHLYIGSASLPYFFFTLMAKLQTYQSQVESPGSCHRDLNAFKESVGRRNCKQMFPTGNSMEIDTPWRRLTKRKPRKHDESCSLQQSSRRQGNHQSDSHTTFQTQLKCYGSKLANGSYTNSKKSLYPLLLELQTIGSEKTVSST